MTRRCWLYELRDKNGKPFYVGITVSPSVRQNAHRRRFGRQISLHKLVCGSVGYCQELEGKLIERRRAQIVNRRAGGSWPGHHWIGLKHSPETRKKMSESGKRAGREPWLRKLRSEVARRPKLSQRGVKKPEELKRRWAELRRRFWADPKNKQKMHNACLGRTQSEATRRILSEKAKARWRDPAYRVIGLQAAASARAAKRGERQ